MSLPINDQNDNDPRSSDASRRHFLQACAGAALLVGGSTASAQDSDETIVLTNGKIHTMDPGATVATTLTIRNNRFVAVGGHTPKSGKGVRVINLKGRTVVPGLVEPHVHIVSLANRPGYHTILENTSSLREVQEALAEFTAQFTK